MKRLEKSKARIVKIDDCGKDLSVLHVGYRTMVLRVWEVML